MESCQVNDVTPSQGSEELLSADQLHSRDPKMTRLPGGLDIWFGMNVPISSLKVLAWEVGSQTEWTEMVRQQRRLSVYDILTRRSKGKY